MSNQPKDFEVQIVQNENQSANIINLQFIKNTNISNCNNNIKQNKFHLSNFIDLVSSSFTYKQIFNNIDLDKPWEVLTEIQPYLKRFFKRKENNINKGKSIGSVFIDQQNIFIDQGSIIQHGSMIKGPLIIGKNCQIRKGAYLRGNIIIGDNCIIGNSCQIKNSIIMNQCQIPHFNYIGDSVLGTKAHVAAGGTTSNFRLDGKNVKIIVNQEEINTNLRKFGAIIGDRCQIGCNTVLNPGSLIGKDCWIYPNISLKGYLQPKRILKLKQQTISVQKIQ